MQHFEPKQKEAFTAILYSIHDLFHTLLHGEEVKAFEVTRLDKEIDIFLEMI